MPITETAFFKFLKQLDFKERRNHLFECEGSELYNELADHFEETDPTALAILVGES